MAHVDDIAAVAASGPATFHDVLRFWAERTPDAPALLSESANALSYAALLRTVGDIGAALDSCGFGRGDRIAVVHPGGINLAAALVGLWSHTTVIPLGPKQRFGEYALYLRDFRADAVAIAADLDTPARAAAHRLGLPILTLTQPTGRGAGRIRLEGEATNRPHESGLAEPDDFGAVLMTSGTTLESKLVPRRQSHLLMRAEDTARILAFTPSERVVNMMQLHHGAGLGAITYALYAGGCIANFPGQDLPHIFRCLEAIRPTYIAGPYTAFHTMLAQQERLSGSIRAIRPNLRMLRAGAGYLDPAVSSKLEAIFRVPVIQAYSSTETSFVACEPLPPKPRKTGSVGLPGSAEIRILDEGGNPLPPNTTGEIVVKAPKIFDGYEDNPAANAKAFIDGWFRMGDLGYFDEDGFLFLTGRIKEVINRGGQKIAPREIDAAIMAHPGVAAAAAFPVPHPTLGDDVAAAVVLQPGAAVDRKTLTDALRATLGGAKVPRQILFVDDIPKGKNGKIQRSRLAGAFGLDRAARPSGGADVPSTPTEGTLQRVWAETLGLPTVPLDEDFFTLGGDSMLAVELFLRVEEALGRRLPRTALFECGTVAEMAAAIDTAYRAQCIVPIQPKGDGAPFFCIHGIDGDMLYFRDLARHLGEDRPFFGVRARGLDGATAPSADIHEMADRYVDEIRCMQPRGPYYIGGYSFGGWAAFEVARRLREAGETVALLAILDTKCVDGKAGFPLLARIGRIHDSTQPKSRNGLFAGSLVETVANHLRLNLMALGCRAGILTDRLEERFRRYPAEAHSVALRRYRPARYAGDAVLFHSTKDGTPLPAQYAGWRKLLGGTLEVRSIGGSHYDMMYEPAVGDLAKALADAIARPGTDRS